MRSFHLLLCAICCGFCAASVAGERKEPKIQEVVAKLRPHFMLGLSSSPNDTWLPETKKQGAQWDVRYIYICGGANTPNNWKTWNKPAGAYVSGYLNESDKLGCIPALTYYQMKQSQPGDGKGSEANCNRINCENAATMKAYFDDFKLLLQKCGEFKKPVIVHHEPDLWGFFQTAHEFKPNEFDQVKVMVKSSGDPDVAAFDDTVVGFGKALAALKDKYAPNALLAWHASKWGTPNAKKIVDLIKNIGNWDLFFADLSDRDAGWRAANGGGGGLWKEADFVSFRNWCGELHQGTGLPFMTWQVQNGNTIMATCNNTDGHWQNNHIEYFLEDYPKNPHIGEWCQAGFIGFLIGGLTTALSDARKDGITNPPPIAGNKGEKSVWPDDDGGYVRTRAIAYYKEPYLFKKGPAQVAPPKEPTKPAAVEAPKVKVDDKLLAEWHGKLIRRLAEAIKAGKQVTAYAKIFGKQERCRLLAADDKGVEVEFQKNPMKLKWSEIAPSERVFLAKDTLAADDDVEGLLLLAVLYAAAENGEESEQSLAKATLKDAAAAAPVRRALSAPAP